MTTLQTEIEEARPVAAQCDYTHLNVVLQDGRVLRTPMWWYPRLNKATTFERGQVEMSPLGVHWPAIDENISVASILRGQQAPGARAP
jgi:hypothetical protein